MYAYGQVDIVRWWYYQGADDIFLANFSFQSLQGGLNACPDLVTLSLVSHSSPFVTLSLISHASPFVTLYLISHTSPFATLSLISHTSPFVTLSLNSHTSPFVTLPLISHTSQFVGVSVDVPWKADAPKRVTSLLT